MTRKLNRNYSLSLVVPFIAILILLIAAAVLAQTSGAGQTTGQANAVLAQAGTSAPAQAERPLMPWTDGAGSHHGSRSHTKQHRARPMDSNQPLFLPAVDYYSGGNDEGGGLRTVAVADLNGDGKPDIVMTNFLSNTVGVLLGNGDGTFQSAVTYHAGDTPSAVAIADVNGDGKPDLIVGASPSGWGGKGQIAVLLGNGDGTFQSPVTYKSAGEITDVAVADLNGDGKPDLIVASYGSSVSVLLNEGNGTFGKEVTLGFCGVSVAVGDVNGDGIPDIVAAGCGVNVALGNGDGTFQPAVNYGSGGSGALCVAIVDVNGDGHPDLVVTNESGEGNGDGVVGVLLGNGDGTFQPAVGYDSGGGFAEAVAVADVDGDGKPDLEVTNAYSNTVGVLLGNGDGTFQAPVTFNSGGTVPLSVVAADVNGDGKPDLIIGNEIWISENMACVGVLLNDKPTTTTLGSSPNPSVLGQPVTFTSVVSSDSGTPTGTVVFYDGSNAIGSATLAGGNASLTTSSLPAGSQSITAAYQSYDGFGPSTSSPLIQVVNGITTTTSLVSSANPSVFAQAVTFTAAVSSSSGTPTGTVVFYDGSTTIGSATLANGSASISISSLVTGSNSITAAYQGSGDLEPSTSSPLNQVVNPAATTSALASSLNPALANELVTYTATVASQYGGAVTGTVVFQDGGSTVGTVTIVGNQAAYSTKYSKPGTHSMTATYSGDTNNTGSVSATLVEQINKGISTKTVLTTSGSPSQLNQPVTFTATITPKKGAIPDGELVTFYDFSTAIGTGTTAGGVATFTTSSLTAKKHTIKATYAGDDTFESSTGSVKQVVEK
jgi:Big-like domain-containing protein/VCBS repeat protein/FG-GAP repeat protein